MRGSHSIQLARPKKKKKEEKHLRVPGLVPLRYFFAPVGLVGHENTQRRMLYCYKGLYKLTCFGI